MILSLQEVQIVVDPIFHTLWLEDQYQTDIFIKWAGKLKKHHPWTVLQLNINNIFNNRSLISTGLNNARYTEGRNIVLSFTSKNFTQSLPRTYN